MDVRRRRLLRDGQPVRIKPKALETLLVLLERSGQVVEKDDLMARLWPDTAVEEANLTQNIFVIRKALGEAPGEQKFIATVARRGYRFVAEVRELTDEEDQTAGESGSVAGGGKTPSRARIAVILLAAGLVTATHALLLTRGRPRATAFEQPIRAIAVLPFRSGSPAPEQDYFADGITEAVITDLASITSLRVVSHQSVLRYKSTQRPLADIARELNVDALVTGAVSRAAGRIRLTVQLVNGRTDDHLWASSYDRSLGDVLALEGDLAREIAEAVSARVTERERGRLSRRGPVDPEAYDLYLHGVYFFARRDEAGLRQSIEYFERAAAKDSAFAPAYAGMALAYNPLAVHGFISSEEARPRLLAAADKALALDPASTEAQIALASVTSHLWDWRQGERDWRRILEHSPNNALARLWRGWLLESVGRLDEALVERELALTADPLSLQPNVSMATCLCLVGRCREAIARFQFALELEPRWTTARAGLAWAYLKLGMPLEASTTLETIDASAVNDPRLLALLGHVYALAGRPGEARTILQRLEARARERYLAPFLLAWVHAGLGESDAAFARLEEAFRANSPGLLHIGADLPLESLRGDPRFADLLRRMTIPIPSS